MIDLDIGCGNRPHALFNLDVDKQRYWDTWKTLGDHNWVLASALNLPFKSKCFDAVYSFVALPYVPNERLAIREMNRILKPEGIIKLSHHLLPFYVRYFILYSRDKVKKFTKKAMIYPAYRFIDLLLKIYAYLLLDNRMPYWFWRMSMFTTKKRFRKLLEQEGFNVTKIEARGKWLRMNQWIDAEGIKNVI